MNVYKAPGSLDFGTAPGIEGSSPGHQFMVRSAFDLSSRVKFDLDFRHVSALPGQVPYVPSYSTADVRIGWQLSKQIELSLVGRNLLQPSHFEFSGDPNAAGTAMALVGIARSGYAQIAWRR
jgi:iron complex outermembrane receptor protein